LHGKRGNRCHAVAIVRGKSFQVGSYARSAGRIKPGYRQQNWWSVVRVVVQFLVFLADIA
jgi:hypothetical protein